MRNRERRFEQDQALFGIGSVNPAAVRFSHNRVVIRLGIVPEERQLESVLAVERSVTVAAIAAKMRNNRGNIARKTEGTAILGRIAHHDKGPAFQSFERGSQVACSLVHRVNYSILPHRSDARVLRVKAGSRGYVIR